MSILVEVLLLLKGSKQNIPKKIFKKYCPIKKTIDKTEYKKWTPLKHLIGSFTISTFLSSHLYIKSNNSVQGINPIEVIIIDIYFPNVTTILYNEEFGLLNLIAIESNNIVMNIIIKSIAQITK